MKKLVLLGGGHSQIEVLRQLAMRPIEDVATTIISRELLAPYSGMLPGFIAGHYTHHESHIDLRNLAEAASARLVYAEASNIDPESQQVLFDDRSPVSYDVLSINVGSRPAISNVAGISEFALPAKPVDVFIEGWEEILEKALDSEDPYTITIVGAGAGGIELALTMRHHITQSCRERQKDPENVKFNVVTDGEMILPTHNAGVRKRITCLMYKMKIHLHAAQRVVSVDKDSIRTESGQLIAADSVIWATDASAPLWIRDSGLYTNDAGFILIDQTLRTMSHKNIFATGDIATLEKFPRPKSGVFAVRQGPYLAQNIRNTFTGDPLEHYVPQEKFLSLIGTGNKSAIASKGRFSAQGPHIWKWKDRIDRKFMEKYQIDAAMNSMDSDTTAMAPMHCAGCGSKIGHTILSAALERLKDSHPDSDESIVYGDDAALVSYPANTKTVISVDHFKSFLDDPFLFGAITATHCLSDLYAMGAEAHNALASVTLPYAMGTFHEDILYELLAGAYSVLRQDGAALVGGHTAEGEDFFFGLTVNGTLSEDAIPKRGAEVGDVLILTKAIGTGVLLVGDQQRITRSPWLNAALTSMRESNREAAHILRDHSATALTDVTGFGLAGHLLEMLQDSELQAHVELEALPLLKGALALSEHGLRSTLYPENIRNESHIQNAADFQNHPRYPLLFDPQTSGGLLAAVPEDRAAECLQAFSDSVNGTAARIGTVESNTNSSGTLLLH